MPFANWKSDYETGNPAIDMQHKRLFEMVNELHEGIVAGAGKAVLGPTLAKLAKYTIEHFHTEEGFMISKGYPDFPRHKARHEELLKQVSGLMKQYEGGGMVLPLTLSRFLADWIAHHIQEEDKALIDWMKKKA